MKILTIPSKVKGFFHSASHTDASNSTFNAVGGNQYNIVGNLAIASDQLEKLPRVLAPYDRAKGCLPGTRAMIIEEVLRWAKNTQENNPRIFWLHGMAGEGKSTIATSVACRLDDEDNLGASFFFSSDIDDRNHPNKVFSSIAFHLSHRHPLIGKAVCDAININPEVGCSPVTDQFHNLLLQPFLRSSKRIDPARSIVIVVDALDECGTANQRKDLLAAFARFSELPVAFKVFLSSRPEKDIRTIFDGMGSLIQRHDLSSGISKDIAGDDISIFIAERMTHIRRHYPGTWSSDLWTGNEKLKVLVGRASNLFIWASTAMKFIEDEEVGDPNGQLEILLKDTSGPPVSESPSAVLDGLYLVILNRAFTARASTRSRDLFQRVVGAILTVRNPLPPATLGSLLQLGDEPYGMVHEAVSKLRSVLYLPDKQELMQPLRTIHPSFTDFLTDEGRSHDFFIDRLKCHADIVLGCLKLFVSYRQDNAVERVGFRYAAGNWCYHFHHILITHRQRNITLDSQFFVSMMPFLEDLVSQLSDSSRPNPAHGLFLMATNSNEWNLVAYELRLLRDCPDNLVSIFNEILELLHFCWTVQVNQADDSQIARPIPREDLIIAVVGPTGSGKTSFINIAMGANQNGVGHDLRSFTRTVQAVRCSHPDGSGRNVVLINTPGFDDTEMTDTDALEAVANWLMSTYKRKITLTGLIFLHRISDSRMPRTPLRILPMIQKLCRTPALENMILATTMWDEVDAEIGSNREEELRIKYWKPMIIAGSRISRFTDTHESAWEIISQLTDNRYPLQLQRELVDEGKALRQTAAGSTLIEFLESRIAHLREAIRKLETRLRGISKDVDPEAATTAVQERGAMEQRFIQANKQKQKLRGAAAEQPFVQADKAKQKLWLHRLRAFVRKVLRLSSPAIDQNLERSSSPSPPIPGLKSFATTRRRTFDNGPNRETTLGATSVALEDAGHVADTIPVPFLRGAVSSALEIAESIELMRNAPQSLVLLAQDAGELIVAITQQVNVRAIPADVRQIMEQLVEGLEGVQAVVRGISERGMTQQNLRPADERTVSAYRDCIKVARELIRQSSVAEPSLE